MNCREVEPLLLAERDGALTPGQRAALAQHVTACPACAEWRARLDDVLATFRTDTAQVALPDIDAEWRRLRAQLADRREKPATRRRLAPVIWFGAPLAAAAALVLGYFGLQPAAPSTAATPAPEIARADFVEAGDANASTMVYVDKDSGWLVVWATDEGASGKG